MPWTVMGPGGPYHEEVEPEELDDGRLHLFSGPTLNSGTWQVFPAGANRPEMPRASLPPRRDRPERKNAARGWGEDNLKSPRTRGGRA